MGTRIRTVNKIGKGKYFTTSWKVSDYLICNIFYSYYLIFKYLFYVPIKWCVSKIIEAIKNKQA